MSLAECIGTFAERSLPRNCSTCKAQGAQMLCTPQHLCMQDHGDTYDSSRLLASETRTFFTAVMFLTRLPCPSWTDHHPAFLMRSMLYFPLTGTPIVDTMTFEQQSMSNQLLAQAC